MPSTSNAYTEIPMVRGHFVYSFCPINVTEHLGNKEKRQILADGKNLFWGSLTKIRRKKKTFAREGVQWKWKCLSHAETLPTMYQESEVFDKNECHITISPHRL